MGRLDCKGGAGVKISVDDLFTRTEWFRRIDNGPWEKVDLTPYGGNVPVVFLKPDIDWVQERTWIGDYSK